MLERREKTFTDYMPGNDLPNTSSEQKSWPSWLWVTADAQAFPQKWCVMFCLSGFSFNCKEVFILYLGSATSQEQLC